MIYDCRLVVKQEVATIWIRILGSHYSTIFERMTGEVGEVVVAIYLCVHADLGAVQHTPFSHDEDQPSNCWPGHQHFSTLG